MVSKMFVNLFPGDTLPSEVCPQMVPVYPTVMPDTILQQPSGHASSANVLTAACIDGNTWQFQDGTR